MAASKRKEAETIERSSFDLVTEQTRRLQEIFPETISEGKVDFENLKALLGEIVDNNPERYSFSWAGKRESVRLLQVPSRARLAPCPEESVGWETTKNIFVEAENLEALKLLYKSYAGRVKFIYIDPPYNTGKDFIYPDNFADPLEVYLKLTGQEDAEGNLLTSNPETSGRYHSAWLSMMYPRLFMARQLLQDDGLIFISIDDNEVYNLRIMMNQLFGEENFIAQLVWKGRQFVDSRALTRVSTDHEYIVVYSRGRGAALRGVERDESKFNNPDNDPRGPWMSRSILGLKTQEQRPNLHYVIKDPTTGNTFNPPPNTGWRYSERRMRGLIESDCILFPPDPTGRPREKKFRQDLLDEFTAFQSVTDDVYTSHGTGEMRDLFGFQIFDFPKPSELIRRLIEQGTAEDDIVLDFFAGSAATAHAVFLQNRSDGKNRRFICIQLPEPTGTDSEARRGGFATIADIAKERIRRARERLIEENNSQDSLFRDIEAPEDLGFRVFKLSESNFRQWSGCEGNDGEKYTEEMLLFTDPLLPGWTHDGVLWEVALREGFALSSHVAQIEGVTGNLILRVSDDGLSQSFLICFDNQLHDSTLKALKLGKEDRFICRDAALSDEQAANLALTCNLKTI